MTTFITRPPNLEDADRADFTYPRKALGLTDGNFSRHLGVLEEASS